MFYRMPFIKSMKSLIDDQGRYPAGHYYSPIPSKKDVETKIFNSIGTNSNLPDIDFRDDHQFDVLKMYSEFYEDLTFSENPNDNRYYYSQDWFCHFDAISLYSFLRDVKPKRIIEVGSGFSSAVMLDTIEQFFDIKPELTFIEPFPDRLNSILRPQDDYANIINEKLQFIDKSIFNELSNNDLLFIDSSHVMKYGSDLHHLFFEIIHFIKKNVYVHFHDIIYTFEYFSKWLLEGRYWNEIYLLRAFLAYNDYWKIHFFNSQVSHKRKIFIEENMPLCLKNTGGSIYIQKIK